MRWKWTWKRLYKVDRDMRNNGRHLLEQVACVLGCRYKERRNIEWKWAYKNYTKWIEMWGIMIEKRKAHGLGCRYKKWVNMRYFENPIVVSSSILCHIFYGIMKWFSFIHECSCHVWLNHVKISWTIVWIILFLCS